MILQIVFVCLLIKILFLKSMASRIFFRCQIYLNWNDYDLLIGFLLTLNPFYFMFSLNVIFFFHLVGG